MKKYWRCLVVILFVGCALSLQVKAQTVSITLTAGQGFLKNDGVTPLLVNSNNYMLQLIYSEASRVDPLAADWLADPGGAVKDGQTVVTNQVIRFTDGGETNNIYGGIRVLNWEDISVPSIETGWLFVRVFDEGSDDPGNLAAYTTYYEGPLIAASSPTNQFGDIVYQIPKGADTGSGGLGQFANILSISLNPDPPTVTGWTLSPANLEATVDDVRSGSRYQLQATTNLVTPVWLDVGAALTAPSAAPISLSTDDLTNPVQFFRVIIVP